MAGLDQLIAEILNLPSDDHNLEDGTLEEFSRLQTELEVPLDTLSAISSALRMAKVIKVKATREPKEPWLVSLKDMKRALGPMLFFATVIHTHAAKEYRPRFVEVLGRYARARRDANIDAAAMAVVSMTLLAKDQKMLREAADEAVRQKLQDRAREMRDAKAIKSKFLADSIRHHATDLLKKKSKAISAQDIASKIMPKVVADLESAGHKGVTVGAIANRIRKNGGPTAYKP